MLSSLTNFVAELRQVGIPVSLVEAFDAATALQHVDLGDREAVRSALATTLVKSHRHAEPFEIAFEVYFGLQTPTTHVDAATDSALPSSGIGGAGAGMGGTDEDAVAMSDAVIAALQGGDSEALHRLVLRSVERFAGIEPGRPVGGRYYFYRVMRRLDGDRIGASLLAAALAEADPGDQVTVDVARHDVAQAMGLLETQLRREIIRRLVADRGAPAVARTLRTPLVEDIELMHATRPDLERIERTVAPLAHKLATRLAQRRRRGRRGRLDVRRTIRRSLSHGGTLLHPRFRAPHRSKPELVLLCDVSGSMATFARFTMQLTYAVGSQFSRVRTFAFIDGLDEVTTFFGPGTDFLDAMHRMSTEAELVWQDGHSDYGNSFEMLVERYPDAITERTTLIVTGDARNNYRDPRVELFAELSHPARAVYWINPEARRYWDTGDSDMRSYSPLCDGVHEVRTLRQLEQFVATVALPAGPRSIRRTASPVT
jgi:hypothetical protein